jgi:hypothetical protein
MENAASCSLLCRSNCKLRPGFLRWWESRRAGNDSHLCLWPSERPPADILWVSDPFLFQRHPQLYQHRLKGTGCVTYWISLGDDESSAWIGPLDLVSCRSAAAKRLLKMPRPWMFLGGCKLARGDHEGLGFLEGNKIRRRRACRSLVNEKRYVMGFLCANSDVSQ